MAEIHGQKRGGRSAARQRATSTETSRRQTPAMARTTQWQRYLDRIRRLVRLNVHP